MQMGPVLSPHARLDAPLFSSRVFRDTFSLRHGTVAILRGLQR